MIGDIGTLHAKAVLQAQIEKQVAEWEKKNGKIKPEGTSTWEETKKEINAKKKFIEQDYKDGL